MGKTFSNPFGKKNKNAKDPGGRFGIGIDAEAIINSSSDGIAIIDNHGIVKHLNKPASDLTGWSANDAVNLDFRTIFQFYDATERALSEDQNPIILSMGNTVTTSLKSVFLKTSSNKYSQIAIRVIPLRNFISEKKGFMSFLSKPIESSDPNLLKPFSGSPTVVIFHDISNQQKENHEQSDFISTASHEMRTPVTVIEGYLGMILNPVTATVDNRARGYAQKAHDAAQHLGHLFQDLLDITKIDDDRMSSNPILVDAGAAAKQAVERLSKQATDKGLELSFIAAGEIQPIYIIYVDLDQLEEILDNLIGNAIKYTKEGSVKVSVVETENRVRISVTDTGIGIPPEDLSHLFQKFYRVDNSDTREIGGTGLGLYLIKKLTEKLGGKVGVDSDYGHGSTFWVEFEKLTRDQAVARAHEIRARKANR